MKLYRRILFNVMAVALLIVDAAAETGESGQKIQPDKDIKVHQIIRIHYSGAVIPEILTVKPGSTVVWINDAKSAVEIQFEGKQVTLACKSPVHFTIDENGSFISDRIPTGSVASLCFIEPGEFSYIARKAPTTVSERMGPRDGIQEFKGKIIVQK
ncbi:MAG: hypothetical protein N3B18_12450 [Desulfobacterota bacterium]|nr:hypothetical protein [Thermodesulfobacteriota bacterium]